MPIMKSNQNWHSLYVPTADAAPVAQALHALLTAQGYQDFDPFPGGSGTPPGLSTTVRLFVAPPQDGWVRVLGQLTPDAAPELSTHTGQPVIDAWLTDEDGGFALYWNGARHDDPASFAAYLLPGRADSDLDRAFAGKLDVPVLDSGDLPGVVGSEVLPSEVRDQVKEKGMPRGANWLSRQLGNRVLRQIAREENVDPEEVEAARAMVMSGAGQDIWNSLNGQRVRAIASVLSLPANWREPAWQTVRDAYHMHRLRERNPRMPLLPGDDDTLKAVPDALAYTPVYMGRA
jgi:hypothetical protein